MTDNESVEIPIAVPNAEALRALLGPQDETRKTIERELPVKLTVRDDNLVVAGPAPIAQSAAQLLRQLANVAQAGVEGGRPLAQADVQRMVQGLKNGQDTSQAESTLKDTVLTSERGKPIGPRTSGQKHYVEALRKNDLVFCIGPAGTGKTYLAVATAVAALKSKQVARIILTRPAVEAGERLGFLPGDLEAKVDPYLRPLFDALYDMLDTEKAQKLIERRIIEVAPLAYMRGRTLNDAFVILDEAQNTTPMQMKMFLTRLGFGSRMVVTGDVTQTDLPAGQESGLRIAARILKNIEGIDFIYLGRNDIVRHNIVQRIIDAYDKSEGTSHT